MPIQSSQRFIPLSERNYFQSEGPRLRLVAQRTVR